MQYKEAAHIWEAYTKKDVITPEELKRGIKVEMEHTDDPKVAEKIALDHLSEDPLYYTKLKKVNL